MAVTEAVRCGLAGRLEYASWHCALPMAEHFPWVESYAHLTLEDLAYHHLMTLSTAKVRWLERHRGSFLRTAFGHWKFTSRYVDGFLNSSIF
jgi:hypothetical protein